MAFDPRQSNPVGIVLVLVTLAGLAGALVMGRMVAQNEFTKIGAFFGAAVGIAVCLGMGKKIWLLIPLGWSLTGKIQMLPLPFSVRDLCVYAAFASFVGFTIFKRSSKMAKFNVYDMLLFVNLGYLATVYARNPVGTRALGTETVGGKPYLDVVTAILAMWVLQHIVISAKEGRILPWLMAAGSTIVATLGVLTQRIPFLVPIIAPLYSGINVASYLAEQRGEVYDSTRQGALFGFATTAVALMSFFRPLQLFLFLRPFWSLLLYGSVVAVFLSGFRTGLVYIGVMALLTSYFWGGVKDVVRLGIVMLLGVLTLIAIQASGFSIHPAAQRALSFIPGPWDEAVVEGANESSEWRFEMWKIALESEKYIKNKILGDGFGFSAYELQLQLQAAWGGQGYVGGEKTETQLVTGAYHSGPISSIRYVGVVGLVLFIIFLIACAKYAWKIIRRAKGTPFFPLALFIGVPAIYKPFSFIVVFGAFESDLPDAIVALAFLNLCSRGLDAYFSSLEQKENLTLPESSAGLGRLSPTAS
jgi:hypothetical protein